MRSRETTTAVLRVTSMPVMVTLALLLLLLATSIVVTMTRAADGVAGSKGDIDAVQVEFRSSSAIIEVERGAA